MNSDEPKNPWIVHSGPFNQSVSASPRVPSPIPEAPRMPAPEIHHSLDQHKDEVQRIRSLERVHPDPRVFADNPRKMASTGFTGPRLTEMLTHASHLAHEAESQRQDLLVDLSEALADFEATLGCASEALGPSSGASEALGALSRPSVAIGDHLTRVQDVVASAERAAEMRGMLGALLELDEAVYCAEWVAAGPKTKLDSTAKAVVKDAVERELVRLAPEIRNKAKGWSTGWSMDRLCRHIQGFIVRNVDKETRKLLNPGQQPKKIWWPDQDRPENLPKSDEDGRWFVPGSTSLKKLINKMLKRLDL